MLGNFEISKRFGSTATSPETSVGQHEMIRTLFSSLARTLDEVLEDNREKMVAFTQLEDAAMWAQKALANQNRSPRIES